VARPVAAQTLPIVTANIALPVPRLPHNFRVFRDSKFLPNIIVRRGSPLTQPLPAGERSKADALYILHSACQPIEGGAVETIGQPLGHVPRT
jgi:hypothetical protein